MSESTPAIYCLSYSCSKNMIMSGYLISIVRVVTAGIIVCRICQAVGGIASGYLTRTERCYSVPVDSGDHMTISWFHHVSSQDPLLTCGLVTEHVREEVVTVVLAT